MAKRFGWLVGGLAVVVVLGGCQHTSITGSESMHERTVQGDLGIAGEDIRVTLLAGSDVPKLSIMGEGNTVVVGDGATVKKVEIVGEDNEVSLPPGLEVTYTEIGESNRLKYRYE
jgi:hypothetical protein